MAHGWCTRLSPAATQRRSPPLLAASLQVIIMFLLGGIFKVEHLSGLEWLISILIGVGELPMCLLTKLITRCVLLRLEVGEGLCAYPPALHQTILDRR